MTLKQPVAASEPTLDTPGDRALPVILVGHGATASALLDAARAICPEGLEDVHAVDAGSGDCAALSERMGALMESMGAHGDVLLIVDIVGSSPWRRCVNSARDCRAATVLGGLSISMLLKLAMVERRGMDAKSVADACAGSAKRAIVVSDVSAEG
jgi:mannose/fructose-specific phosphotransferase system component IIA